MTTVWGPGRFGASWQRVCGVRTDSFGGSILLMLMLYLVALTSSLYIGGAWQCVTLMVLGFCHNDPNGAEKWMVRNCINACGYIFLYFWSNGNRLRLIQRYDILLPMIAVNTTRSKKEHDQRRRTWDRAFTSKDLAPLLPRISDL